jgi:hypothetical protein
MPFLTAPTNLGTTKTASYATTIARNVSAEIPVGRAVFVEVGTRNDNHPSDTGTGETNKHVTLVDTVGNVYTKIAERSYPSAAFEPGLAVSLWYTVTTVAIPNASAITCTFDMTRRGRMINVQSYGFEEEGSTIAVAGYATAAGRGGTIAVTLNVTADEITWMGAGFTTTRTIGDVTVDSTFTNALAPNILDNGFDDSGTLWSQYRFLFTDTETWNATIPGGSTRWTLLLAAITVVPPPAGPPVEGTREYQADFETDGHEVVETSTVRRPDAVSRDYLQAVCMGPVAIGDPSEGIQARRWHVRADGLNVYVKRSNAAGTAWEDDTLLFTCPGSEVIQEVSVAFAITGRIVVAMQRPNGVGGEQRVSVYRWHSGSSSYAIKDIAGGTSPRVIDDYFQFTYTAPDICPPEVYVQLMYMKPTFGLARRSEIDDWTTDNATNVSAHSGRKLETLYKTVDKRICGVLSRRISATGRYDLEEIHSRPYLDSAIRRPTFIDWTDPAFDLMRRGNSLRHNPASGTTTADYQLRIQVADACDAIEVAATGDFPFGSEPPFEDQEQEFAGTINAGDFPDFVFSATHGGGASSLVAVRARIRRTVGMVTCYSPWRYTVFPADWGLSTAEDDEVNCGYDLMVDLDGRMGWMDHGLIEGIRNTTANSGGPCDDPLKTNADTAPGGEYAGWWFVGGQMNTGPSFPFPTHFVRFSVRRRPWALLDFIDEDGIRHAGVVVGEAMESTAGSAPDKDFDWSGNRFPRQFPDDTGLYPDVPPTLDIIRSE